MFTGLVETVGILERILSEGANRRLVVKAPELLEGLAVGDSVAHNGTCLTVEKRHPTGFEVVAVAETLAVTTLGELRVGDPINLERALLPTTRMGGHWVQGHVDGIGKIVRGVSRQGSTRWQIRIPKALAKYCIARGSIALDGISLTLETIEGDVAAVNIIPHTASRTNIRTWKAGKSVNIEVDLLAKYVERLLGKA
jgi:riboflavin synthase